MLNSWVGESRLGIVLSSFRHFTGVSAMDSHRRFDRRLVWVRVPRPPPLSSDGSLAWLKRMLREHKTEGSNPSRPTISTWERSRLRVTSFGGGRLVGVSPTPTTISRTRIELVNGPVCKTEVGGCDPHRVLHFRSDTKGSAIGRCLKSDGVAPEVK